MRTRFLAAVMASAALAAAGCGSSSSSPTPSTSATNQATRGGLDAALNALCQRANTGFGSATTNKAKAAVVAQFLATARSIKVPAQLKGTYSRYVSVIQQELADVKKGDLNGVFNLAHSKAKPLARQLGATGCVTGS